MVGISQFSNKAKHYSKIIAKNADVVVKETALAVDRNLVLATPVDTGRARSNWVVSFSSPDFDIQEPTSAEAAILQASLKINQRKENQDIYISNNVKYIGRLNEGYSAQAPALFVQISVQNAVNTIRNRKVLINGN
jgi:hypothetical protein